MGCVLNHVAVTNKGDGKCRLDENEWLNALVGRIFVSIHQTTTLHQYFITKIQTKFERLKRPPFLETITVADLHVGDNVPVISNPRLLSLAMGGELEIEMEIEYQGGFSAELQTQFKLGGIRVPIALAVDLNYLKGKLLVLIQKAPTNRIWVGFYEMPKLELRIEPIIMQRQVKYLMVVQAIESQVYEAIRTSIVLPNMDDTVFFKGFEFGGIFEGDYPENPSEPIKSDPRIGQRLQQRHKRRAELEKGGGGSNCDKESGKCGSRASIYSTVSSDGPIPSPKIRPQRRGGKSRNESDSTSVSTSGRASKPSLMERWNKFWNRSSSSTVTSPEREAKGAAQPPCSAPQPTSAVDAGRQSNISEPMMVRLDEFPSDMASDDGDDDDDDDHGGGGGSGGCDDEKSHGGSSECEGNGDNTLGSEANGATDTLAQYQVGHDVAESPTEG
ncbi:hypothetical protein EV182_005364, partial [Spiromyces aspiralis]